MRDREELLDGSYRHHEQKNYWVLKVLFRILEVLIDIRDKE